jgi:hypothetical protein
MVARTTPAVFSGRSVSAVAVQLVGEGVHLLLDDVGDLAEAAHEQRRGLHDRGAHLAVAVSAPAGRA